MKETANRISSPATPPDSLPDNFASQPKGFKGIPAANPEIAAVNRLVSTGLSNLSSPSPRPTNALRTRPNMSRIAMTYEETCSVAAGPLTACLREIPALSSDGVLSHVLDHPSPGLGTRPVGKSLSVTTL